MGLVKGCLVSLVATVVVPISVLSDQRTMHLLGQRGASTVTFASSCLTLLSGSPFLEMGRHIEGLAATCAKKQPSPGIWGLLP